jgi:cytochrome b561
MPETRPSTPPAPRVDIYSGTARMFHWIVAGLVLVQIPLGFLMVYRGSTLNIWDSLTNTLYSSHKLIGMVILAVMLARLGYRLMNGVPADEPTIEPWQKSVSHLTHWALYILLIGVAFGGWLGVSLYGATGIFDWFSLPSLAAKDQAASERIFFLHFLGALAIAGLASMHIGAALYHHLVRKDGVLRRMLPRPEDKA